jgi:hypothetical protein
LKHFFFKGLISGIFRHFPGISDIPFTKNDRSYLLFIHSNSLETEISPKLLSSPTQDGNQTITSSSVLKLTSFGETLSLSGDVKIDSVDSMYVKYIGPYENVLALGTPSNSFTLKPPSKSKGISLSASNTSSVVSNSSLTNATVPHVIVTQSSVEISTESHTSVAITTTSVPTSTTLDAHFTTTTASTTTTSTTTTSTTTTSTTSITSIPTTIITSTTTTPLQSSSPISNPNSKESQVEEEKVVKQPIKDTGHENDSVIIGSNFILVKNPLYFPFLDRF